MLPGWNTGLHCFRTNGPKSQFFHQCHRMQNHLRCSEVISSSNTHLFCLFCFSTIDLRLRNGEDPRGVLCEAQEAVTLEIQEQISDYRSAEPSVLCASGGSIWLSPLCTYMFSMVFVSLLYLWCRSKRTLGLGSLYGENDLLDLDGDPLRERQMAEKQLAALGDILWVFNFSTISLNLPDRLACFLPSCTSCMISFSKRQEILLECAEGPTCKPRATAHWWLWQYKAPRIQWAF